MRRVRVLAEWVCGIAVLAAVVTAPRGAGVQAATPTPTRTPNPIRTPSPTKTPKPTRTPSPTRTATPAAPPPLPARFYGAVTWFGRPLADPAVFEALVGEAVCGMAVAGDGVLVIDVLNSAQLTGCGTDGATVTFRTAGMLANETATFKAGAAIATNFTGPRMSALALAAGCAAITSTFPDGTPPDRVRASVSPGESLSALWLWDAERSDWDAYVPNVTMASNLRTVSLGDPLWLCVTADATFFQPLR